MSEELTQILVRAVVKNKRQREYVIGRAPQEATLLAVVRDAVDKATIDRPRHCAQIDVLGIVEPHLFSEYPLILGGAKP